MVIILIAHYKEHKEIKPNILVDMRLKFGFQK